MLKILVIAVAIMIAAVNSSAQPARRAPSHKASVVRVGPTTTYLKEGLSTEQVVRLLGEPVRVTERTEQNSVVTTYEFRRAEGRILVAEFVNNILRNSRVESRTEVARSIH
ncbi:MAG TPA: hypothetical protein VJT50_05470 [Pyrinomonadaceae bacterium]|nr:hypothetical protein [Pyrinomonadaceae bacterium]